MSILACLKPETAHPFLYRYVWHSISILIGHLNTTKSDRTGRKLTGPLVPIKYLFFQKNLEVLDNLAIFNSSTI